LLLLNASLIDSSQLDYQIALTEGFNDMRERLAPFVGGQPLPALCEVPEMEGDASMTLGMGSIRNYK
jgi:hypothetical protein